MESLIKDAIEGFVILAIICGIYGLSNDVLSMAGKAQKDGLISYSKAVSAVSPKN